MKKILFLLVSIVSFGSAQAQSIVVSPSTGEYGDKFVVNYDQSPTGGNFYFYQNVSMVPSFFYKENVTLATDQIETPVFEPGLYTVRCEYDNSIYASAQFRVNDIAQGDEDLTIFLMTDIHVMARSLAGENEAYESAMSSNRKMLAESEGVFTQLIDSVISFRPDVVLIPGDLTKDGELISHQVVLAGLQKLSDKGIRCLVIPGNHDYNNPNSVSYTSGAAVYTPTISENEFAEIYRDFGYDGKRCVRDTSSLSYYTDEYDKLRIIGIDATRNRENTLKEWGAASNRSYGDGKLRSATLQWVLDRADEAYESGRMPLVMVHHQLLQHFNNQDKVFSGANVQKGDSIALVLLEHHINIVLTGHMHINNVSAIYDAAHTDSLVEISTGSTIEYPACWRWLTLNQQRNKMTVNTRYVNKTAESDDFMLYGRDLLLHHTDILWTPISNMMWNAMRTTRNSAAGSSAPMSTLLDIMLNDKDKYSDLAYTYMKEPIELIMLMASEANENLKYSDLVLRKMSERMLAFADEVINSGEFNIMERAVLKAMLQQISGSMFEDYLGSLLTDCSYCGTNNENTTNDLYLALELPSPRIISGLSAESEIKADDDYYDVLGRRYNSRPSHQGIYMHKGKKIYVMPNI